LFNAVMATGVEASRWAEPVDTVWVDFTKGLGAPLGAVLTGPADWISEAWTWKHRLGGALRQAGMMAAGCLYALEHHVDRLADDHARAQRLADGLEALGIVVERPVETNILFFDPAPAGVGPADFCTRLAERGVGMGALGHRVRAVTNLNVDDAGIGRALDAAAEVVSRAA
jgi:threonine aldolase